MGARLAKRARAAFVLLACGAMGACGEDPVAPELIGWFSLNSLEGRAPPAPMPCSSADSVLNSLLYLGSDRSAGYSFAMRSAAGDTVKFEGTGTFEESASTLVMTLEGRWTGEEEHVVVLTFQRDRSVLRQALGAPCDDAVIAEYLPALVSDAAR